MGHSCSVMAHGRSLMALRCGDRRWKLISMEPTSAVEMLSALNEVMALGGPAGPQRALRKSMRNRGEDRRQHFDHQPECPAIVQPAGMASRDQRKSPSSTAEIQGHRAP